MVSYNCALDTTLPSWLSPPLPHSRTVTLSPRQHKLRVDKRHDALDERHRQNACEPQRRRVDARATLNETGWGVSHSTRTERRSRRESSINGSIRALQR